MKCVLQTYLRDLAIGIVHSWMSLYTKWPVCPLLSHPNHPLLKCSQLNGPSLQQFPEPETCWCFLHPPPSTFVSTIKHLSSFLPPVKYSCSSISTLNSNSTTRVQVPPISFKLLLTGFPSLLCSPNHPFSMQPKSLLLKHSLMAYFLHSKSSIHMLSQDWGKHDNPTAQRSFFAWQL